MFKFWGLFSTPFWGVLNINLFYYWHSESSSANLGFDNQANLGQNTLLTACLAGN